MTVKIPVKTHCTFILAAVAAAALAGCSQQSEATDKLDQTQSRMGISATAYPNTAAVNSKFIVSAAVTNVGQIMLPALGKNKTEQYRVGISYHWLQTDGKVVVWDGVFTPLKSDMKKGDLQTLDVAVKSPAAPGTYILEVDGLQSGAFWFSGVGSQSARIFVTIT